VQHADGRLAQAPQALHTVNEAGEFVGRFSHRLRHDSEVWVRHVERPRLTGEAAQAVR
jgi:hypothetical protein